MKDRFLIKLCGVRSTAGANACVAANVDFAGLNFVSGRSRCVDASTAVSLVKELGAVTAVGVFQNQSADEVARVADQVGLHWVQLHGDESADEVAALADRFSVIKAITAATARDQNAVDGYARSVKLFIVDGRTPGSGEAWRYEALKLEDGRLSGIPVLLAGGLTPQNVGRAIDAVRPCGVDTASGVEVVDPTSGSAAIDVGRAVAFSEAARATHARRGG